MADANSYRNLSRSADLAADAAVVVSPLLNLAPSAASGPRLEQRRPLLALGSGSLAGTATLSLAPDRRSVEVSVHLDGGGAPSAVHLRRIASHHLRGGSGSYDYDLLLLEVIGRRRRSARTCLQERFSLDGRGAFLPFERVSDLRKLEIDLSALMASSIDGVRVEGAYESSASGPDSTGYLAQRMLTEIKAAERSAGVVEACKHLELANLYARRLGSSDPHASS